MQQDDKVVVHGDYTLEAFWKAQAGDVVNYETTHFGSTPRVRQLRIAKKCKSARHQAWVRRSFVDVDAPANSEWVLATLVWGEFVQRRGSGLSRSETPSDKRTNGSPTPAVVCLFVDDEEKIYGTDCFGDPGQDYCSFVQEVVTAISS